MNRRDFLRTSAIIAAGVIAADQLEMLERLAPRRLYVAGIGPGFKVETLHSLGRETYTRWGGTGFYWDVVTHSSDHNLTTGERVQWASYESSDGVTVVNHDLDALLKQAYNSPLHALIPLVSPLPRILRRTRLLAQASDGARAVRRVRRHRE